MQRANHEISQILQKTDPTPADAASLRFYAETIILYSKKWVEACR
jgi:hypothetical protein